MLPSQIPPVIKARAISREAYSRYGDLICADDELPFKPANMGTAKRFNHLGKIINLRPSAAELNLCVFRCQAAKLPIEIKLLEKHPQSTQAFLPMRNDAAYLAIVCLGDEEPDLETFSAFVVEGAQGITYRPGVWHYPMTAIGKEIDFSCLIWEDGSKEDCRIVQLPKSLIVEA